ncbi:MAG: alkaline phosphatase family protein [Rhodoglobus sp.]|nr:alkaline phosphatase family protein [Rhodoglobus sp.]
MLPAAKPAGLSLADVLQSSLHALASRENRLSLPPVDRAIVVLVDGLGADALKACAGHARTMAGALNSRSVIEAGFPTTTASALGSLTTGTLPGQHGLVGYSVLDSANDRVVNQLTGWDSALDPLTWQLERTVFERAREDGFGAVAVGPERYRDSGFSAAVLRGAWYVEGVSIGDRMSRALEVISEPDGAALVYVYIPELDMAAHAHGWQSREWTDALETADAALRGLVASLGPRQGLLVTADHGIIDVPGRAHVLFDTDQSLVDGVRFVAGEPRCLQLHLEPDLSAAGTAALIDRWRASEADRAWVVTRDELIESGWLGEVRPEVRSRIGDVIVAARKAIAYYDTRVASSHARAMIGQHGSVTQPELRVPLLRYGAFAT